MGAEMLAAERERGGRGEERRRGERRGEEGYLWLGNGFFFFFFGWGEGGGIDALRRRGAERGFER